MGYGSVGATSTNGGAIRILIAGADAGHRHRLSVVLAGDPDLEVVAEACDGEEALQRGGEVRPDLVILASRLPGPDEIHVTRALRQTQPRLAVLIIDAVEADGAVARAVAAGAGVLLESAGSESVLSSIRIVLDGHCVLPMGTARRLLGSTEIAVRALFDGLSPREIEVLRLLAAGRSTKQLARELQVADKTVRNHIANIYTKLGIHDRAQAVRYAMLSGVIEPG
jgi:DNA-binding NarL/FixJ family response regulator